MHYQQSSQILKRFVSFYADIIRMPSWPSTENVQKNAYTLLLLLKLYLSNNYLQAKEISETKKQTTF